VKDHTAAHKHLIIAAVASVLLLVAVLTSETLRVGYEFASLRLWPDAQKAYEYGNRHFNSSDRRAYDIDLAGHFYWRAQELDPYHAAVYHQIARISFLKNRLSTALFYIDTQIARHGDTVPSAHYMRGLILGYRGDYDEAARSYERFLEFYPDNWAAITDYSWVLLKAGRPYEAAAATGRALALYPKNPWLLNTNAIALHEIGDTQQALLKARAAQVSVASVTVADWLEAYPGNDPRVAQAGIDTLRASIVNNVHTLETHLATGALE
jgi:tetratricopeptide (TPR) repeat protein